MVFGQGKREQVTKTDDDETWVELQEYPGYAISDHGRVVNMTTDMLKHPSRNQQGIMMVNFSIKGKQHVRSVALLVINTFRFGDRPNDNFDTPIHLNGQRTDCRAWNLLWRPRWFSREYHKQFQPAQRALGYTFREPIIEINSEEVFENSWTAATTYGLLDKEIYVATVNNTFVFPTNQRFRTLRDE